MKRGPKPKPTQLKRLAGNPGKRKLNDKEPKMPITKLEPAKINATAKKFSARYLPMLREARVLTDADLTSFELMATHYATAWRAAEIVEKEGMLKRDIFGGVHKHPLLQVMRDNSAAYLKYAAEFGLTPSSRSRIIISSGKSADPFEEFMRRELKEAA